MPSVSISPFPDKQSSELCGGIKSSQWGLGIAKLGECVPRSPEFSYQHHINQTQVYAWDPITPEMETGGSEGVQAHGYITSSKPAWVLWTVSNRGLLCDTASLMFPSSNAASASFCAPDPSLTATTHRTTLLKWGCYISGLEVLSVFFSLLRLWPHLCWTVLLS